MKFRCIESRDEKDFVIGKIYEAIEILKHSNVVHDGLYKVLDEDNFPRIIVLNGLLWKFEIINEEEDKEQRKQDVIHEIESLSIQLQNEINKLKELL